MGALTERCPPSRIVLLGCVAAARTPAESLTEPRRGLTMPPAMNAGFKSMALLFVGVLAAYLGCFYGLEHLRHRKGAWVGDFHAAPDGAPELVVSQDWLGVTNVTLRLAGEKMTNGGGRVVFDRVKQPVPFGRVIYEDLTFLPGVITFDLYGHEVELVPRLLVADRRQLPWQSEQTIELWPSNKPAIPPHPPKTR